ncbi:hypothetical protein IC006_2037 [Sulfuracidifex tepidarius]|uniref:Uncharacterized protein n=1 Tax=Sulfuracidifex tepidarius TaxID=1294262 RepID=A0A510E4Q8_9CREN|nr:hypothetical protein IC006_2037 [Sulfuracidifex tepidarius]BBG27491.1 hypothetical protein IC007_2045 [Sulfuracidifex tepidarius]
MSVFPLYSLTLLYLYLKPAYSSLGILVGFLFVIMIILLRIFLSILRLFVLKKT